jgi:hypothetical protein
MAKSDLEASRTLLFNKHYPQAIFYFEQAVEKGIKSLGLWMKVITEEECKDMDIIGHNAWNVLQFIIKNVFGELKKSLQIISREYPYLEQVNLLTSMQEIFEKFEKEAMRSQTLIENLLKKDAKTLAFCEEELEKLRDTMSTYKNGINIIIKELPEKLLEFEGEDIKTWKKIINILDQLSKIIPISFADIKEIVTKILTISLKLSYYATCLFCLSIITCPHTADSRYPKSKENWNPIEKYNETTPLIKMLPFFTDEVQEAFNFLSELYTIIPQ